MRTCTVLILVFSLTIVSLNKALCQTPAKKEQDIEKVVVGTNEVVLDAVVKDKKGHAVKDLTAADFEISGRWRASGSPILSPGHARIRAGK